MGEGRESPAYLSPKGHVPLESRLFGGDGASLYRFVTPCLADASRRDDRPPTHFFVKKEFIPADDAESPERVLLPLILSAIPEYPGRLPARSELPTWE